MLRLFYVAALAAVFLCGCATKSYLEASTDTISESEFVPNEDDPIETNVYVQVTGAVNNPGVYKVEANDRLFSVIEMAGGLREDAAMEAINQAAEVVDGASIYVPTLEEAREAQISDSVSSDGRININTAGPEELMSLRGIGQSKAELIISYRETNGPYKAIEDLMNIQGIKEGVFNKIKDDITVGY